MSKVKAFLNNFDSMCVANIIGKDNNVLGTGTVEDVLDNLQADYVIIGESVKLEEGCMKIYVK